MAVVLLLARSLASLFLGAVMFVAFSAFLLLNNLAGKIYESEIYIQTLREQNAYARFYNDILLDEVVDRSIERILGGTPVVIQEDLGPLLREIIPPAYLQKQVEANVFRAVEYLNEDAESLNLYLEMEPIINQLEPALFGYIDQRINQTQVVRPDPSQSIPEQVAEMEALMRTLSRELAQGRLPQAVPSLDTVPRELRSPLFDAFMASIIREPALDARIRRALEENSPDLRRQFVDGNTRKFLREVVWAAASPLFDDDFALARSHLDPKGRLDLISVVVAGNPEITEESLRRDIADVRNRLIRDISRGRLFALVIVIGSALALAAVHLPNLTHSLRWPGLALLLTGLISYLLSRALESSVANKLGDALKTALDESNEFSEAAAQLLADVTQALAFRLVEGMGNPGLILAAIGLLLFAGSFFVHSRRRNSRRPGLTFSR